jgi:hypothetical protein
MPREVRAVRGTRDSLSSFDGMRSGELVVLADGHLVGVYEVGARPFKTRNTGVVDMPDAPPICCGAHDGHAQQDELCAIGGETLGESVHPFRVGFGPFLCEELGYGLAAQVGHALPVISAKLTDYQVGLKLRF